MELNNDQIKRYDRNMLLDSIGVSGQKRLLESSVFVIGAGGLGSPVLMYLAGAGVGRIGIADSDTVEYSNLNRQFLYSQKDLRRNKSVAAAERVTEFNTDISAESFTSPVTERNISGMTWGYDIIMDCTDNFETKYMINDYCVSASRPYSHAGVSGMRGQVMTYLPGSACLRCIFKTPPEQVPGPDETGVLGAAAGVAGSIQGLEAVKYLCGGEGLLVNSMLFFNAQNQSFRRVCFSKQQGCICG